MAVEEDARKGRRVPSFRPEKLEAYATALLGAAGLPQERAEAVASVLLEADLMGHTTHGLQLLGPYLAEIEAGRMRACGEPATLSDRGGSLLWDGECLPGPWLVKRAIAAAQERLAQHGCVTVVIRRSHHIACLAAYLRPVAEQGLMLLLASSDPAHHSVSPFGGLDPVMTPNPLAAAIPTDGEPILLDVSTSITTNGMSQRLQGEGARFPHPWLKSGNGQPSDDPAVLAAEPPGTIMPIGGLDHGHKGFALGLLVEALTAALGGYGRADRPLHWGASVFVQLLDPAAFGGRDAFRRESGFLAAACRASRVRPGDPPVRLPGARGLALRARHLSEGLAPYPGILERLADWNRKLKVTPPDPL